MKKIVVAGEALFDIFVKEETMTPHIGGSPLNVAMGLARMGENVSFFGGLSHDFLGKRLANFIKNEKINDEYLQFFDKPTTLSLIELSENGVPKYAFYGANTADRAIEKINIECDILHIGSYAMVVEPFAATLSNYIKTHKPFVCYDPNIRLGVVNDTQIWRDKIKELAPFVSFLKMSDEDFKHLYDVSFDEKAHELLSQGVKIVVITKGKDGAIAFTKEKTYEVAGVKVQLVDTVGAGDTFQAACIAHISKHGLLNIENMLAFAVKAASITCSKAGANLPYAKDLL